MSIWTDKAFADGFKFFASGQSDVIAEAAARNAYKFNPCFRAFFCGWALAREQQKRAATDAAIPS